MTTPELMIREGIKTMGFESSGGRGGRFKPDKPALLECVVEGVEAFPNIAIIVPGPFTVIEIEGE